MTNNEVKVHENRAAFLNIEEDMRGFLEKAFEATQTLDEKIVIATDVYAVSIGLRLHALGEVMDALSEGDITLEELAQRLRVEPNILKLDLIMYENVLDTILD